MKRDEGEKDREGGEQRLGPSSFSPSAGNKSFAGFWVPGCSGLGSRVSWDSQKAGEHLI